MLSDHIDPTDPGEPDDPPVSLLACPWCARQWLVLDEGPPPKCPINGVVSWRVVARWAPTAAPWWPLLIENALPLVGAKGFLHALAWYATQEHPAGPIGAHRVTPGMELVYAREHGADCTREDEDGACTIGCRTTWHFTRCAGSEN